MNVIVHYKSQNSNYEQVATDNVSSVGVRQPAAVSAHIVRMAAAERYIEVRVSDCHCGLSVKQITDSLLQTRGRSIARLHVALAKNTLEKKGRPAASSQRLH